MSNTKKVTRAGAGRKAGSFSFTPKTAQELLTLNPNPNFKWLVSRIQVQQLGGEVKNAKIGDLKESLAGQTSEPNSGVTVIDL